MHEVELLWLATIAAARRSVYVESQYFASRRIAEAIADRLREPDGPDVVVVNPWTADGWLSEKAMGTARARVLEMIREADVDRFRLYTPVTEQRAHIVHAKVAVIDDRLLRLGSSNVNNRSMGLDTECDLAIEAVEGDQGPIGSPRPSSGSVIACSPSTSTAPRTTSPPQSRKPGRS